MTLATLLAAGGFFIAALTFHQNTRIRRAEWLLRLYEKFYENSHHRKTRYSLDFDKDQLLDNLKSESDKDSLESFSEYLNFFEFLGSLLNMKQIKRKEVQEMFDYYIQLLRDPRVDAFCQNQGFENTLMLLNSFPDRPAGNG